MISAEQLIPKTYESDAIFSDLQAVKDQIGTLPKNSSRSNELWRNLLDKLGEYHRIHAAEWDIMATQERIVEIARDKDEFSLARAILNHHKQRLAIINEQQKIIDAWLKERRRGWNE
jgi:hypothetical protein